MDGIIFDVDGTLWDSTETVLKAWNQVIEEMLGKSYCVSVDTLKGLFGKPMNEICDIIFPGLSPADKEAAGKACFDYENALLETEPGVLYEGVRETLEVLSSRIPLFIVSNCQCGYIELFLQGAKLREGTISGYLCYGDTLASKDVTIRRLMAQYGLNDAVYVGDTLGDALACEKAQVPFILAAYGFESKPIEDRLCRNRIHAIRELLALV